MKLRIRLRRRKVLHRAGQDGVSKRGQFDVQWVDPKFWRQGRVEKRGQPVEYGASTGDSFTVDIRRAAHDQLSFQSDWPGSMAEPIVRNLPNGQHTIELITTGDGEVAIESLYVSHPPEKD